MKKNILIGLLLSSTAMVAQKKIQVAASYGSGSFYGLTESLTESILTQSTQLNYESDGVFAVDVMMGNEDSRLMYGLSYSHEQLKDPSKGVKTSLETIEAQATYKWLNPAKKFNIYSGVGAGVIFGSSKVLMLPKSDDTLFAFNVTPIGIRYGTDFSVFAEANIGTRGIVQGGVAYTF